MNTETRVTDALARRGPTSEQAHGEQPGGRRIPARDVRLALYCVSLALDLFALIAGFFVALLTRDNEWLSAGGTSLVVLALPIFVMFAMFPPARPRSLKANTS